MEADRARLSELAEELNAVPLYAVGGYVRDMLLGYECGDIDLCAPLTADGLKNMLSSFTVSEKSMRMGTVQISKGNFRAEYTAFRTDSYEPGSGKHCPNEVRFTDDIREDALRRDFKCNAVYLRLADRQYVDPLGGIEDIKNKILSAADEPRKVFEADGLRLLRLVRFAAELGFDIEAETFAAAKAYASRVEDIAAERVRDELSRIFVADTRHGVKGAHLRGLRLLDEFGLIRLLLPELAALKGLKQNPKYHLYDAYEHSLRAFEAAPPRLRWAALLHDIGKAVAMAESGTMRGHENASAALADDILGRLKFSNDFRRRTVELVQNHMIDINGNTHMPKLRRSVVRHADIIEDLLSLMDADAIASAGSLTRENRLRAAYEEMQRLGLPMSVDMLKIDGNDLVKSGVPAKMRADLLKRLLEDTALDPNLNDREAALRYIEKSRADTEVIWNND